MTANRAQTRAQPRAPARVATRKAAVNRGKRGKPGKINNPWKEALR